MRVRPWTLPAAASLSAAEAAGLIVAVAISGNEGGGLWILFLAVKFPFCWLVARRRPGAYLALLVWELAGVVAAVGAQGTAVGLRLLEVATAGAVVALLIVSMPLFPTVTLSDRP